MSNIISDVQMNFVITNVVRGNQGENLIQLRNRVLRSLLTNEINEKDTSLLDKIDSKIKQKIIELS